MADTQIATSGPEGSLPATMINPDTTGGLLPQQQPSTLVSGLAPPKPSLPQSAFDPVVANLGPKPAPAPTPTVEPTTAPAVAPPPATAPAAPAQPGAPRYVAVGDSLAAGIAQTKKFNQTYEVKDDPAAKANPAILAASGRTTDQTLAQINANPKQYAGADVLLSTGMSNDLMGGRPLDDAMTNVASQLDALRAAGANVALAGVGSGVPGYQQANARLAQIAKAYNIPFTGEPATTQGGRVHPHDYNAFYGQFHFGEQPQQQPPTPGTGKTISDATDYIQHSEGGGPYVLYGGQTYDPRSVPTKPGYYGFPDWAGGYGPDGRQTHAAGGAQWEPDTWKNAVEGFTQQGLASQLGHTPDFRNPDDQKAVFNYWAARRYREQTGRDIVADMNAGHVDWTALGGEWSSLKYGGGGATGMTVGNTPSYQRYHELSQQEQELLRQQIAAGQKALGDMQAGSPEQRALMDQLMQKRLQLMDKYEEMIAHPPTQKPVDVIGNFGSIATLIGIFAGRFAHRPMVASLNAAGAAMQAINDNNYQQYQNAFKMWKTQTDMTQSLLTMEGSTYKDILDNKRIDDEERFRQLDVQMRIFQNAQGILASERGDLDKQVEIANKAIEMQDTHAKSVADVEHLHAETEKANAEAKFPLLGPVGQERSELLTELQKQADANAKSGKGPTSVEELAKDANAVSAARQNIEQQKATARYGKPQELEIAAPDGTTTTQWAQQRGNQWFEVGTDQPVDLSGGKKIVGVKTASGGGHQAETQNTAIVNAGNEASGALKNLVELPITANGGLFMGVQTDKPREIMDAVKHSLASTLTSDEAKDVLVSFQGVARSLATLEAAGRATGLVGLTAQAQLLMPQAGDSGLIVLRKYAEVRQLVERSLDTIKSVPSLQSAPTEMKKIDQIAQEIRQVFPYTVSDINKLERGRGNEQTVLEFARKANAAAGGTSMPAWATDSAVGPSGETVYYDGKGWFHLDHTPYK